MNWGEIEQKIVSVIEKIKEHPILDGAAKTTLSSVPVVGSFLLDWYDNISGTNEEKTQEILSFLETLRNENEQNFNNLKIIIEKNREELIHTRNALSEQLTNNLNILLIEELKNRKEIFEVQKTQIEHGEQLNKISKQIQSTKYPFKKIYTVEYNPTISKPSIFRGEKKFFVGRTRYFDIFHDFLKTNQPIMTFSDS